MPDRRAVAHLLAIAAPTCCRLRAIVPAVRQVVSGLVGRFESKPKSPFTRSSLACGSRDQRTYKERPRSSVSKLHTYRDGVRILSLILLLLKAERPFRFFARSARWSS